MRVLGIGLAVLAADQASKAWIATRLALHESEPLIPGVVRWTLVKNRGAAFGLLPDQTVFFTVVAVLVVAGILYWMPRLPSRGGPVAWALGLQLGGALGNLVDRLRWGYVVDFVDLEFWPLHRWPVFNVADAAIVSGTALLVLWLWRCDVR